MDNYKKILDKYSKYIIDNNINNFEKIEKIIKSDEDYSSLDIMEEDALKDELIKKIKLKKTKKNITIKPSTTSTTSIIKPITINQPITDADYATRVDIFNKLRQIVLPEQRSKEWFEMRNNKITASDCGAVLGENKYEPQFNFILKKVFGSTFETNDSCYHGKKFENVVTLMYEYNYDTIVDEFGLLGHPEHLFLGASPDGICGPYKRDGKTKSPLVGRMLEIKCPLFRKIKYEGEVKGEICPIYYWCQVQQQLECCNLDECDFVQCSIEEYKSREDFLNDSSPTKEYLSLKSGLEKGALIELVPLKISEEDIKDGRIADKIIYDKTSFIYQPKIDMTNKELDEWLLNELDKISRRKDVKLNRIIYWRILEKNCTLIMRDKEWFNQVLPKLKKIWNYVELLREDNNMSEKWKEFIDKLPKKMNEKIITYLDNLIKDKNK
jgi:putative phage-type endonuclease